MTPSSGVGNSPALADMRRRREVARRRFGANMGSSTGVFVPPVVPGRLDRRAAGDVAVPGGSAPRAADR
jgi:hypothetical protein